MHSVFRSVFSPAVAALALATTATVQASDVVSYYIGIDNRSTPFNETGSAPPALYPDNPNQGRLTFLFHHGNHFHGIGTYNYSGPATSPTLNDTNSNNRVPEGYTAMPPISLLPGSGSFADTFRSGLPSTAAQDLEYGNLEIRNVHSLAVVDVTTYNSSSNRWNAAMDGAHIHLKLLSATPGLNIAVGSNMNALTVDDEIHVGDGDEMFSFLPTFWVDNSTPIGSLFSAEFILEDEDGFFEDSGRFFIDFQVVPEPTSAALLGLGGLAMIARRRRASA